MAGRDPVRDAPLDDLVGHLPPAPVGNGATRPGGGLAGQGDDLADLLGGDPGRAAGVRGVGQALLDAEVRVGDAAEADPAVAPEPGRHGGRAQLAGDPGVIQAVIGGQDDPGAEDELLRGRMPPGERLQRLPLGVGQGHGGGPGTGHDLLRGWGGQANRGDAAVILSNRKANWARLH
jgi:hypothetical protein